jgi:hypothetical protein
MTSGSASAAFCSPTCCWFGDSRMKLSGLAMRNMTDSTLNWLPRLMTEKKSTP